MEILLKYFPDLSEKQRNQFLALFSLYKEWNEKINVISRKDIDNLYIHHILHSLGIAYLLKFKSNSQIMDVGTGGGFPGVPLAILFPDTQFHLVDSIGKKIKVAMEISTEIKLENVTFEHIRAEEIKRKFDFVVSRAVMSLIDLEKIVRKNIQKEQYNSLPNGLICLKGGELQHEIKPFKNKVLVTEMSDFFEEEYFKTKKIVYLPI